MESRGNRNDNRTTEGTEIRLANVDDVRSSYGGHVHASGVKVLHEPSAFGKGRRGTDPFEAGGIPTTEGC